MAETISDSLTKALDKAVDFHPENRYDRRGVTLDKSAPASRTLRVSRDSTSPTVQAALREYERIQAKLKSTEALMKLLTREVGVRLNPIREEMVLFLKAINSEAPETNISVLDETTHEAVPRSMALDRKRVGSKSYRKGSRQDALKSNTCNWLSARGRNPDMLTTDPGAQAVMLQALRGGIAADLADATATQVETAAM